MPHSILSFSHSKHTCAGCGQLAPTEDGKLVTDRAVYTLAWGEMIETAKQGCLPCLFLTAIMMELEASGTIDVDVARRGTDEHSPAYPGYDAWTRMNIQLDRSGDRQRRHYNVMTAGKWQATEHRRNISSSLPRALPDFSMSSSRSCHPGY
jgi:hypothetical protein